MNKEVIDEKLSIDRRLLGFAGLSNFGNECSSSRYVMFSGFLSQHIPLDNGEPKIILSGLEKEYIKTLFGRKLENDSRIVGIVDRYNDKIGIDVNKVTERYILYIDTVKDELNYINIPVMEKFSPKFGFKHRETDALSDIEYGDILSAGTKLSRTNSENDNGDLCIGLNVNMCLGSFKEIGEDAVIISESFAKRASFKTYEVIKLQFGNKDIPLNLYGDDDNYKILPDIGEYTLDSGLLFASRHVYDHADNTLLPALMSMRHLKQPRPIFDKCYYLKGKGKVIDIKVLHNPKLKKTSTYNIVTNQMDKYVTALNNFYNTFIATVNDIRNKYNNEIKVGDKLHRLLVDMYSEMHERVNLKSNQEELDLYHVEVTLEFEHTLGIGGKLSGNYGDRIAYFLKKCYLYELI